jgi:integrase
MTTRRAKGTGSLVTRGDQRLGCYVTVGGQRVYAWCPRDDNTGRRQEAELRRLLNARDAHRLSPDARQTLADYLTQWLASRSDLAPTTRSSYQTAITRQIVPGLGGVRLADLTPVAIEAWLTRLTSTRPGAAVKAKAILSSALTDAVRLGLLPSNPARSARLVQPPPPTRPLLDATEVHRLLDAAATERLGALVVCAALLGLRRGELLGLRWVDVDVDARRLVVAVQRRYEVGHGMVEATPKADSRRVLVLPSQVVDALRRHQCLQATERGSAGRAWVDHGLVFANTRGYPHWQDHTSRLLRRVLVRAGLPHRRLHDLRHAIITYLLHAGASIAEVQQVVGHRSLVSTARYAHGLPEPSGRSAALMEAALVKK